MLSRRGLPCLLVAGLLIVACSDDTDGAGDTTTTSTASADGYVDTLRFLAEAGDGRDNLSDGSRAVQARLAEELGAFAEPLPGGDGFLHSFGQGTNLLGVIEGTTNPSEVVVLGAHYDHLGHDCASSDPADEVCDGAGDNAAGVATVLEIGRRLAADPPARTVVIGLWDAEEDGALGSQAAVRSGVLDIGTVVAYLNWDMQGINLLPSLTDTTFVIGAESGGPALEAAVGGGLGSSDLQPVDLSLLFGQGRSDHASFAGAGIPIVFFSDATSGCYHTAQDDLDHLDLAKLGRQIDAGTRVAQAVADGPAPAWADEAPAASYADAQALSALGARLLPDLDLFPPDARADVEAIAAAFAELVADGEAAFDAADAETVLARTQRLVELFTAVECNAFVD